MYFSKKKAHVFIAICVISLFVLGVPTMAAISTPALKPGKLSISAPTIASDFTTTTLNGIAQTMHATLSDWSVVDATGSGRGWNVTVQASQLTEVIPEGSNSTPITLPAGSISLTGNRSIIPVLGSTPVDNNNGPVFLNSNVAIDASTPVKILNAQPKYGKGTYNIIEPNNGLSLTIQPKDTLLDLVNYPDTPTPFSTILTYSITTGP